MNAMDKDNGQPLFQIMTPNSGDDPKEVYIRANPAGTKAHIIGNDVASLYTKRGGKGGQGPWNTTMTEHRWVNHGWKEARNQLQRKATDWKSQEGSWIEYNTVNAAKDPWKDFSTSSSSKG